MKRKIESYLTEWKNKKGRKILLVRGARQVGKTWSIRELGKTFKFFIEVNFEEEPELNSIFQTSRNPSLIREKLSAYFHTPIIEDETLLFFDEVQACPECIQSLRFFNEKLPDLHVAAAGSLLEFTLNEISSFGVGRITSIFMYPLSFEEFLWANNYNTLYTMVCSTTKQQPIDDAIHLKLLELAKTYMLIGGLPFIVKEYILNHDIIGCHHLLDSLITTYQDDFSKYKHKANAIKLTQTFSSIANQTGDKFTYGKVSHPDSSSGYKECLDLLIQAGLAYRCFHTSAQGTPLGATIKPNRFKVFHFDLGIYQRLAGLGVAQYLVTDFKELINKGEIAELFVALELIEAQSPYSRPTLFYWHREARSSNAEVDFVIQRGIDIIPVEVKSGTRGSMQSMHLFLKNHDSETGIRLSHENCAEYGKVKCRPFYLAGNI